MLAATGSRLRPALAGLLLAVAAAGGCSTPPAPWAVDEVSIPAREQYRETGRLDAADRAAIRGSLADLAEGHEASRRPERAPRGVRASDLPAAVAAACADVQMAVVRSEAEEDGTRFDLRTIEDRPATLRVVLEDAPPWYRAEATVGRFGDERREAALLAALDRHWRAFGRKRKLE